MPKLRIVFLSFFIFFAAKILAQDRYIAEVGILGGGTFYLGDANATPFKSMDYCAGGFLKYKFNERFSLGLQATGGKISVPPFNGGYPFRTNFADVEVLGEFNFFDFGYETRYNTKTKPCTPYIFLGAGASIYTRGASFMLPFGVGGKFKLSEQFNLGLTWSMKKLFQDNLDNIDNPRSLERNVLINNDWYSEITLYLSFDFWNMCATCQSGLFRPRR